MVRKEEFRFEIPFDSGKSPRVFSSPRELSEWATTERGRWQWLTHINEQLARQVWATSEPIYRSYERFDELWNTELSESERDNHLRSIKNEAKTLATSGVGLDSADPRAQFVLKLSEDDRETAFYTLLRWPEGVGQPVKSDKAVRGIFYSTLFELGLHEGRVPAELESIDALRRDWLEFTSTSKRDFELVIDEHRTNALEGEKQISGFATQSKEMLQETRQHFDAIEATYDKKLALQKPVAYWSKKVRKHRCAAICFTVLWIVIALLSVGSIYCLLHLWLFDEFSRLGTTGSTPTYWPLAVLLAAIAMAAWPLRIVSRLLMSSVHLAADAEERATMINTYLSLLRSNDQMPDDHQSLILAAIFRSAATGIVKEDGSSAPTATELMATAIGAKK